MTVNGDSPMWMVPAVRVAVDLGREPEIDPHRPPPVGVASAIRRLPQDLEGAEVGGSGEHADDGERGFADADGAAHHSRVAGEPLGPERLADERHVGPPDLVL